jgi:hypothetical protein
MLGEACLQFKHAWEVSVSRRRWVFLNSVSCVRYAKQHTVAMLMDRLSVGFLFLPVNEEAVRDAIDASVFKDEAS